METRTFDKMVAFLGAFWESRSFIVPCLVGPVGIGKTAAVLQHAENVGANKVVTIIASQILPNEVSGITMPDPKTKAMEIYNHFRLGNLEDGDIIFFDELLEADQLVLSACLTLIESRQLMSGTKLPDVQIIAATNPTITPQMLKENIRQRFVWQNFPVDPMGTREYIHKLCGFDPGDEIAKRIETRGSDYNILSPRSLTKMCQAIASAPEDKEELVAEQIDRIWHSSLGTEILKRKRGKFQTPIYTARKAIRDVFKDSGIPDVKISTASGYTSLKEELTKPEFTTDDLGTVMTMLEQLPEWQQIADQLSNIMMSDEQKEVSF